MHRDMIDVRSALGSDSAKRTTQLTLFIPSVDRDGRPISQSAWVGAALTMLAALFRGATAFPPGRGVWRDDERGAKLVFDETVMIMCYADREALTDAAWTTLRVFLHRLGREADQGEVGFAIAGEYHPIRAFDRSEGSHGTA